MKFKSKFNLNDRVFSIDKGTKSEFRSCDFCEGSGQIECNSIKRTCPECYGRAGSDINVSTLWMVTSIRTIGLIRIEVSSIEKTGMFDNIGEYDPDNIITKKVQYMLYETGIGSGVVYLEDNLFASKKEAQARCDDLNNPVNEMSQSHLDQSHNEA